MRKAQRTCNIVSTVSGSDEWRESAHRADTLECALGAVGAGFGIEAEGTECAEVLELGEAFGIESIQEISGRRCLNGCHVEWSMSRVQKEKGRQTTKGFKDVSDQSSGSEEARYSRCWKK